MTDNKKNSFFSWIKSKMKKNNTINEEKEQKNVFKKNKLKNLNENIVSMQKILKTEKKHLLINNENLPEKMDALNKNYEKNMHDKKNNFFTRLKNSLTKTKKFFGDSINFIFMKKKIDDSLFDKLEEKMLLSDIGINTTNQIIRNLTHDINRNDLQNAEKIYFLLKKNMHAILKKVEKPLELSDHTPFVILVLGVNGTGKTTTVIKLAKKYKLQKKSVLVVAGDTFRAAGIKQLQVLGEVNNISVLSKHSGSDPASVIFDAMKSAQSKKIDVLIIDTAGRLHNNKHLMEELKKIIRVIKKIDSSAPHEKMLIIDACNGQNTLQQTKIFHQELNLTGMIITKLDGTAKGGVIFSLANEFNIPIRYLGVGEKSEDLGIFDSTEFIQSIFK